MKKYAKSHQFPIDFIALTVNANGTKGILGSHRFIPTVDENDSPFITMKKKKLRYPRWLRMGLLNKGHYKWESILPCLVG